MNYMKTVLALLIISLGILSCNYKNQKNMKEEIDLDSCFVKENVKDIGVLRIPEKSVLKLYSRPDTTAGFASIRGGNYEPMIHFTPEELKDFFHPLYYAYSGTEYPDGKNYDISNYIIRDLTFRVVSSDGDWIKIVFDEKESRTCYLKNLKELYDDDREVSEIDFYDSFETWENYFFGGERIYLDIHGNPTSLKRNAQCLLIDINIKELLDKIDGKPLTIEKDEYKSFWAEAIEGEWMYLVEYNWTDNAFKGWVRWRNEDAILIDYQETWGLE